MIRVDTRNGCTFEWASPLPVELVVPVLVTMLPPMLPLSEPLTLQAVPLVMPPVVVLMPALPQRTFVSPALDLLRYRGAAVSAPVESQVRNACPYSLP